MRPTSFISILAVCQVLYLLRIFVSLLPPMLCLCGNMFQVLQTKVTELHLQEFQPVPFHILQEPYDLPML